MNMERTLISQTPEKIGEKVSLSGWINVRRDHGKLIFLDLRDRTGIVQVVILPDKKEAYQKAKTIKNEFVVNIFGKVKERPSGQSKEGESTNKLEIEVEELEIISATEDDFPFEISAKELKLNAQTLFDNRNLSLRNRKINDIFRLYSLLLDSYGRAMRADDFLEIKSPKILSSATEGGANFFKIKYFKREAFLAQSPQFYKQAGVGAFERVFEIGTVFRAEPHFTTRHVNEFTGLDAEMGFISDFSDIMDELEKVMRKITQEISQNCVKILKEYGGEILNEEKFPRIKLEEALKILKKEYNKESLGIDIDPEGERMISDWVKKKYHSDFVFLTHYPVSGRPFYTMPGKDLRLTESFDLIFKGVEIATGGQRIHNYHQLIESIKRHRLDPKDFADYLNIFKLGMPPHGGWGIGSERIVQKILNLSSVKEAILFPRDVKRLTP